MNRRLTLGPDGAFEPVPQFSDLRNRALCDVFFGISAMERAGTGLTDTCELAAETRRRRHLCLSARARTVSAPSCSGLEASAGSTTVARDTSALSAPMSSTSCPFHPRRRTDNAYFAGGDRLGVNLKKRSRSKKPERSFSNGALVTSGAFMPECNRRTRFCAPGHRALARASSLADVETRASSCKEVFMARTPSFRKPPQAL